MPFDYFWSNQSEMYSFYRIPKELFTKDAFRGITTEAKVLYGLLLDRMALSAKNGWLDEQGRVYLYYPATEIMEALGCANQKATKLLKELEVNAGLIERVRQGLGHPDRIYVKNFMQP